MTAERRCPWCAKHVPAVKKPGGTWWHFWQHKTVRVYCLESKRREKK